MRHGWLVLVLVSASLVAASAARAANDRTYLCGDAGSVRVTIVTPNRISATIDFPGSDDGRMTVTMDGGGDVENGFRFVDGEYQIVISGARKDRLTYDAPDFGSIACAWDGSADSAQVAPVVPVNPKVNVPVIPRVAVVTPAPAVVVATPKPVVEAVPAPQPVRFPADGRSCGGILRQGPGMDTPKLASLRQGDALTILEQAGQIDGSGFAWFKVKAGAATGYQYGGILSVSTGHLSGAFVGC